MHQFDILEVYYGKKCTQSFGFRGVEKKDNLATDFETDNTFIPNQLTRIKVIIIIIDDRFTGNLKTIHSLYICDINDFYL